MMSPISWPSIHYAQSLISHMQWIAHTHRSNSHFTVEPGLASCPCWFSFSTYSWAVHPYGTVQTLHIIDTVTPTSDDYSVLFCKPSLSYCWNPRCPLLQTHTDPLPGLLVLSSYQYMASSLLLITGEMNMNDHIKLCYSTFVLLLASQSDTGNSNISYNKLKLMFHFITSHQLSGDQFDYYLSLFSSSLIGTMQILQIYLLCVTSLYTISFWQNQNYYQLCSDYTTQSAIPCQDFR